MSRPSLAVTAIRLALTIYIACRDVMLLWHNRHWLAFDFKVAHSSVGALAARPPISLLSSRHTETGAFAINCWPNKTSSTRVECRSSMNLLIFV